MAPNTGLIGGAQKNWYDDIANSQPGGAPKMEGYTPTAASASQWTVSPEQTVESRTENIIKRDSPLSQLAEARSLARSNERGLINSSMAIGAGQKAVYDAAVPIATADANMFGQAARTNAELGTQANIASAGFSNEASRFGAGARNDLTKLALTERGQDTRMGREFEFRTGEAANLAKSVAARDQVAIQADRDTASRLAATNSDRDKFAADATSARDKFAAEANVAAATALAGTNATAASTAAAVLDKRADTLATVNKAAALFGANVNLELAEVNRKNSAILNKSANAVNSQSAYAAALNSIAMSTIDPAAKETAAKNAFTVYKNSLALISSVDNMADLSKLVDFSSGSTPTPATVPSPVTEPVTSPVTYPVPPPAPASGRPSWYEEIGRGA